jgi:hypothetical protein
MGGLGSQTWQVTGSVRLPVGLLARSQRERSPVANISQDLCHRPTLICRHDVAMRGLQQGAQAQLIVGSVTMCGILPLSPAAHCC